MRLPRRFGQTRRRARGVSLLELVAVIVVIGVLASLGSVVLTRQAAAYAESLRRAELSDMVSGALTRVARDVRRAVPGSCRTTMVGDVTFLEVVLARGGGIYRRDAGGGDPLNTAASDTSFNVIGRFWDAADAGQAVEQPQAGDIVVINNQPPAGPVDTIDNIYSRNDASCAGTSYGGCNTQIIQSIANPTANEPLVTLVAGRQFPADAQARFIVANPSPVTFRCEPTAIVNGHATGTLRRISGYAIALAQPTPNVGANDGLLAENVSSCTLSCNAGGGQGSLVWLSLGVSRNGQAVTLYQATQIQTQ